MDNNLTAAGEIVLRIGVRGMIEDANSQMTHGLAAQFGVKNLGLPAVYGSDIDTSDGESLRVTLENARQEISQGSGNYPTTTLKCIAKRMKLDGKHFVKCGKQAIRGDQFCPTHLCEGRRSQKNIKSLLILDDEEELPEMKVMVGV